MVQKIVWALMGVLVLSLVLLLGQVMPDQEWVVRHDQGDWRLVASGWALVWRAWPLVLLGAVVGFVGAWSVLAWLLTGAGEADVKAQVARLSTEQDRRVSEALQQVAAREAQANQRAALALAAQQAAEQAQQAAERAQDASERMQEVADGWQMEAIQQVQEANVRVKNALCMAERLKRRAQRKPPSSV